MIKKQTRQTEIYKKKNEVNFTEVKRKLNCTFLNNQCFR